MIIWIAMNKFLKTHIIKYKTTVKNERSLVHFNLASGLGKITTYELPSKIEQFDRCPGTNPRNSMKTAVTIIGLSHIR